MRRVIVLILCLSLLLCLSLWLFGCVEEKNGDEIKSDNTENNNTGVVNTHPMVNITSPSYFATFSGSDPVNFKGIGIDQEDGELTGDSLQWVSSPSGYTGTGSSFSCLLPAGIQMITLKAVDSEGATSSESTIVIITPGQSDDTPADQPPQTRNAQVELHGYITKMRDCEECIKLLGELKNSGSVDATFCKITFTFKDDDGNDLGSAYTYVQGTNKTINTIPEIAFENNAVLEPSEPNNLGGFMLFTDIPYEKVSHYEYAIEWREDVTSSPDANLIVDGSISSSETESSSDPELWSLQYSGKIKNTGNRTAILGYITFILKNSDGDVIDIAPLNPIIGKTIHLPNGDSTNTAVLPNGTGTFTTWSGTLYLGEASSYDYKIKWFDYHETTSSQRMRGLSSDFMNNSDLINNIDQYDPKILWKKEDKATDELKEKLQKGKIALSRVD